MRPNGGETAVRGQNFNIVWRQENLGSSTVSIELLHSPSMTLESLISASAPNTGSFNWAVPGGTPAGADYVIRITRNDAPAVSDTSDATFAIADPTPIYYVNDSTVEPGDWTTAPGSDLNDGLTPATPKATIQGMLSAYDFEPGDIIRVDRGVYNLTTDIAIGNQDSGVTIVGFTGASNTAQWSTSVLGDAPTHYYRLGESIGPVANDSSGNGNHATYENGIVLGSNGALDQDSNTAVTFDGVDDQVRLPNGFANFTANGFSFEAWVNPSATGNFQNIFDLGNGQASNNIILYRSGTGTGLTFQVYNGGSGGATLTAPNALLLNEWQHLTVTLSNTGAAKIYRNGALIASGNVNAPVNVTRTSNFLGLDNWPSDAKFAGRMDEVAFYSKVLTETQIAERFALTGGHVAVVNRGSTTLPAFALSNADNVTISNLKITGAYHAVQSGIGADSDGVMLSGNELYGTVWTAIEVGGSNDNWTITGNVIHGAGGRGISFGGGGITFTGNIVSSNSSHGLDVSSPGTISDNTITGNVTSGIIASLGNSGNTSLPKLIVENNTVFSNGWRGIELYNGWVVARGNTVYGHTASTGDFYAGIYVAAGEASNNIVHSNRAGITSGSGLISANRVYNNSVVGITASSGGVVQGNTVYNNGGPGIYGLGFTNSATRGPWIRNNLVYSSGTFGIFVDGGTDTEIWNNTVHQTNAADGIALGTSSVNTSIRNNIVMLNSGIGLNYGTAAHSNLSSDYNLAHHTGAGSFGRLGGQTYSTKADFFFDTGFDHYTQTTSPQFVDLDGADEQLGYVGGVDRGSDDNFALAATSPGIDAGHPSSHYLSEPQPNGARINLGHHGNTAQATTSSAKTVSVLTPDGLEKLTVGVSYPITFASAGLAQSVPVLLMNAGGREVGQWGVSGFHGYAFPDNQTTANAINTSLVTNPAPQKVYQDYIRGPFSAGAALTFSFPVPDGAYSMRLHFMEPSVTGVGQRRLDIKLNGSLMTDAYDIYSAAGNAQFKATALSYAGVTASGGNGITLDLVPETSSPGIISAVEIFAATPSGSADPRVNIDVSLNNGGSWSPVTTNVALDPWGRGSFNWTPDTASSLALIRVSDIGSPASDTSNATFIVGPSGQDYYVNDNSTAGDFFTTAAGNDSNSGKSPADPMRSLAALLAAYTFSPGDVIHVDTGTYVLSATLNLGEASTNVTIEGPPTGMGTVVINRNNSGSPGIRFDGADNLTLRRLSVTGALYGLFSELNTNFPTAISTNITIDDCDIYGNGNYGVYFQNNAYGSTITNSRLYNNSFGSINFGQMNGLTVSNNKLYNSSRGVGGSGSNIVISGNEVYGNTFRAIEVSGTGASTRALIQNNIVRNNTGDGISGSFAEIVANTVFAQTAFGVTAGSSIVRNNVAYGNGSGISVSAGTASGNRVYNNTNSGIDLGSGGIASGNFVYNNTTGILAGGAFSNQLIQNNLVYLNSFAGVRITSAYAQQVLGNTIYQPAGDGVRIEGVISGQTKHIKSNIIQVGNGYGIWIDHNIISEVASDFNTVFTTGAAKFGRAGSAEFTERDQWFFETRQDRHSLTSNPLFIDIDGADNLLGYVGVVDRGQDDNFQVQPGSPTVDAGNPSVFNLSEPTPNGNRINQGYTGNTSQAVTSAAQIVQLTSPNGFEKLKSGSTHTIRWRSDGLTTNRTLALLNVATRPNGTGLGDWQQGDQYGVVVPNGSWHSATVNTSGVSNPGPQDMYQSYAYANNGAGNLLSYRIPLADGDYTLRLHWAEPFLAAGQRQFDIKMNGVIVQTNLDVASLAGAMNKAIALPFAVTASGGDGALIELVNKTSNPAFLNGMDITAANPSGIADPTATLEYSINGGGSWLPIASGIAMDVLGNGAYDWIVPASLSEQVLVRVTANQGTQPSDTSNSLLQIVNSGNNYYVNDGSLTGNVFTTALGSNLNSGKSPDKPMASIFALLQDYDLGPGDVVHVDAGTYALIRNITLLSDDSGVVIQGPAGPAVALLNREHQTTQYASVFQFLGADYVTIDRLSMINAYNGIEFGLFSGLADSDNNTISNNDISQTGQYGIYMLNTGEDNNVITGNKIHDGIQYGISAAGTGTQIIDNEVFNLTNFGIHVTAPNGLVSGNTVFGNATGIHLSNNNPVVSNNIVRNNTTVGISAANLPNALITGNIVFQNPIGIASTSTPVIGNRVFGNTNIGIDVSGVGIEVRGNQIYSNATGLRFLVFSGGLWAQIYSNLIYANTTRGILIEGSNAGTRIWNNTIYSIVGDAIRLTNSPNVSISNNILWTNAGSAIFVSDAASQTGLTSDRNLFNGSGSVGSWNGAVQSTLGNWQAASSKDATSLSGDPLFVDIDGADNVLGFRTVPTTYDGGTDDNFFVAKLSPAIDRGQSWNLSRADIYGGNRVDDPATLNAGTIDYTAVTTGSSQFTATGTAKNWRSGNTYFGPQALGFSFPFFGTTYTQVYVGTNGMIQFGTPSVSSPLFDANNTLARFASIPAIAPLWDAINTFSNVADDIFVDTSVANQIKIRWNASQVGTGADVQFAVVLFSDGTIRFDYGAGNTGLTPTVGISSGNGQAYTLGGYDGQATLTNANSIAVNLAAGFTDLGAIEFRGTSSDVTPPTISSTTPAAVHTAGTVGAPTSQIVLNLNEALNRIDAAAVANYELRSAGPDNQFDTGDDIVYQLTPQYTDGDSFVTLLVGSTLPDGMYRLTVKSNSADNTGLHDRAGILLDGDGNVSAGGNYVRTFAIGTDSTAPTVIGSSLDTNLPPQSITLVFSEDVSASLSVADLVLQNLTTSTTVPAANLSLSYNAQTNTATITFLNYAFNMLPDGNYLLTLPAGSIADGAGNPLATDATLAFLVLAGDANGDGIVNVGDLGILATHWQSTGQDFANGDFNLDGSVNVADLGILATNWQKSLAAPARAARTPTSRRTISITELLDSINSLPPA
jgi:parallel beta-helix repeat protein